jgi:shikimate kinase
MTPVAVLVGPPGAGKTTIGQLLAARLGVEFRDVDHDIEATAGKPISDIFLDDGEVAFRALEVEAVAAALDTHDGVVALGGGAVLSPVTRQRLKQHRVVYLEVGLSDAVNRVGLAKDRPVLALNPRATLRHLLDQRRPLYEEVAVITVDTGGRTPEDITDEVAKQL